MDDWDRPARDDYRDWQDSVDRDWETRERFDRLDEAWAKGGEADPPPEQPKPLYLWVGIAPLITHGVASGPHVSRSSVVIG